MKNYYNRLSLSLTKRIASIYYTRNEWYLNACIITRCTFLQLTLHDCPRLPRQDQILTLFRAQPLCWCCWHQLLSTSGRTPLIIGGLGPTFRNACGNLCETIKKVWICRLFRLLLSFYLLGMAFKVFPFSPVILHCNSSGQPLDIWIQQRIFF